MRLAPRSLWIPLAALVAAGCSAAAVDATGTGDEEALKQCAAGTTVKGVDVSYYDEGVDWATVKSSGRAFAITRVSDGLNHVDPKFAANWSGIKSAGLVRGVYQYFRASQDAIAQADLLLSRVGTFGDGDLPPILDVEVNDGASASTVRAKVSQWLTHVEQAIGRAPIVYTMASMGSTLGTGLSSYPLWVANFGASCPKMPDGWSEWKIFQSSDTGSVPGISTKVDLDLFNGSLSELRAFASGWNGGSNDNAEPTPSDPTPPDPSPPDPSPPDPTPPDPPGSPNPPSGNAACLAPVPSPGDGHHDAGNDCLSCHASVPGAQWTVAGTLFASAAGGAPVSGATIEVVDANGNVFRLATNDNGNFYTDAPLTPPIKARASSCPSDTRMQSAVSSGSCNGCHGPGNRIHL